MRLQLIIKKVPYSHILRYLVPEGDSIKCSVLREQLEHKFSCLTDQASLACYLTEPETEETTIKDMDYQITRAQLVKRIQDAIPTFTVLNGMQTTSLLSRLQQISENVDLRDFKEDLGLEDEDSEGILTFDKIQRIWRIDKLPKLEEDLWEFLKIIALRHSTSLREVRYKDLVTVFSVDYELTSTPHDDLKPFNHEDLRPDSDDIEKPQEDTSSSENDEFIIKIDDVLRQIIAKLPERHQKTILFEVFIPFLQMFNEDDGNVVLCIEAEKMFEVLETNLQI